MGSDRLRDMRILVVARDERTRHAVSSAIHSLGVRDVRTMADIDSGPDALAGWRADAVLLDGAAADGGGAGTVADLWPSGPGGRRVPVLLIPADGQDGTGSTARKAGFAGVVRRPFAVPSVYQALTRATA